MKVFGHVYRLNHKDRLKHELNPIPLSPVQGKYSQFHQANIVDEFFYRKRLGFFFEAGAGNGIEKSNTLYLEYERNWRGILVEPNPVLFRGLLESGRRSPDNFIFNTCLSTQKYPQKLMVEVAKGDAKGEVVTLNQPQSLALVSLKGAQYRKVFFKLGQLNQRELEI